MRDLVAIPVYNEEHSLAGVLRDVLRYPVDVLVVDDGSTDATAAVLGEFPQVAVHRHEHNRGYGAALIAAFTYAVRAGYRGVITLDSDGQHLPSLLPQFQGALADGDIVSGSRYLADFSFNTPAPPDRRRINLLITDQLNARLGLELTDAFCGFKAYRTQALERLRLSEPGYAMPMELWVQAACRGLSIREIPVPRVYLDPTRSFGETLDDADSRLEYYQQVIDRAIDWAARHSDCGQLLR